MSEDMAVGDNATTEEAKLNGDEAMARATDAEGTSSEPPSDPAPQQAEELALLEVIPKTEPQEVKEEPEKPPEFTEADVSTRGIKRRASSAFSDNGEELRGFDAEPAPEEEFRGFNDIKEENVSIDYGKVLQLLEAEVTSATKSYTPIKTIKAIPTPLRASKRNRQDTDGSRPSSALSSRSDGEGLLSNNEGTTSAASSPANRGRRSTIDVSSPLLRVPLELGWKRELVYRATLDSQQRRNADIYYYTPFGKKLRSTREVAETLSGTGLTLENFSFFKEPLGIDDPEKEIIRDARLFRKMESPAAPPAPVVVEGKRTPKPKQPKGASPEPATTKSPQAKIKVKSVGSRLSGSGPPATKQPPAKQPPKKAAPADNNNSAAWKKPRQPAPTPADAPVAPPLLVTPPMAPQAPEPPVTPPPPPPLQLRPQPQSQSSPDIKSPRQVVQPCSMTCGRGVPTLSCAACLCLYHPACAGHPGPAPNFMCKNCRKSTSPPLEPPPLLHKWGVPAPAAPARPRPLHLPVTHTNTNKDKRVLLRMKVAGGGPDGERVWAVAKPQQTMAKQPPPLPKPLPVPKPQTVARPSQAASPRILALRPMLPQSLAVINGRRFIVVPRNIVTSSAQQSHEEKRTRSRLANGAASPDVLSPRSRRGRPKVDDTDHFTAFYNKAQEHKYNVVVQIFQYLGMRELAVCARVCRLWRTLSSTPALWRHVRMKNSHVSDWGGLCAALKRHGTVRLDLRKMLLPQNDAVFWQQFALHIPTVDTLERIEMCRCPATAVEAVSTGLPNLRSLSALAIRDALLDPAPLGGLRLLRELRLKSMNGLSMTQDLRPLAALTNLQHLSLTSIKDLGWCASDIIGQLDQLESLELGECTFRAEFAGVLGKLKRLRRLRLERGTAQCAAPQILRTLATLPLLTRLELVNIDVKVGFDDALAECKNIQRLLIIPTYVSQSATTNKQVLSGVLRLKDTLTHLMWGVTIELLRVTELFIDQCEQAGERAPRDLGECIPVLKPVPGCRLPDSRHPHQPPQVEILPLPTLQRLLSAQLPHTKLKLLRIPFHATWRQTLADFQ